MGRCHFLQYFLSDPQMGGKPKNKLLQHVIHQINVIHQPTENITTYLSMFANKHMMQPGNPVSWEVSHDVMDAVEKT